MSEAKEYRGDNGTLSYKQKFDFDHFGNLYRKTSSNPTTGQATPLPFTPIEDADISKQTNRFTANTIYDDVGNVTQDTKFRNQNFSYDANGRMFKTASTNQPNQSNAVYDASGQRIATQVDNVWTFFVYDVGGKMVAEYGGLQATDEGGVKYLFSDWQGSTRAIVSNSGFVQARMDYTTFGEEINSGVGQRTTAQGFGSPTNLRQKYGSTERDEATGLDHTWFRKNENKAGRWTSPDPYNGSMSLGNPQSFNRYSYVENQPTNFVDPSGLLLQLVTYSCWCVNGDVPGWTDPNPRCETCHAWVEIGGGGGGGFGSGGFDFGGGGGGGGDPLQNVGIGNNLCGIGASVGEFSNVQNNWWKGKNGNWYKGLTGRGPNGATGARTIPIARANTFKAITKTTFVIGAVISVAQGAQAYNNGRSGGKVLLKAGLDIGAGYVGAYGGPPGAIVAAGYLAVDLTIGVDNIIDEAAKPDNGCARKMLTNRLGPPR